MGGTKERRQYRVLRVESFVTFSVFGVSEQRDDFYHEEFIEAAFVVSKAKDNTSSSSDPLPVFEGRHAAVYF